MHQRILVSLFLLAAFARAQDSKTERTIDFGFEQRVRNEDWNNILDYSDATDDQRTQVRYRTRVWLKAPLGDNIDVNVGLNQETNTWQYPKKNNHLDEVVFETANINIKKLFVKGLSLTIGRQNIMKGEGFVLFEGNPGDGSRSTYFNAVDLAYSWKKSKLELLGIMNPKRDRMLPRFNDQHKILQDWDMSSLGWYYTDNNNKAMPWEAYYLYTKEVHDYLAPTNYQFQPDRHISMLGGRLVRKLPQGWSVTGEYALEWGAQHPDVAIRAWGGYGYLKKQFKHSWKPYVLGGYWAMSGDNPNTKNRIEGWDPLYGRWPKWSELYIYSQVKELGVAYWTNMGMWQAETGFSPHKMISARFTYYHMGAFQPFTLGSAKIFGKGTDRGDNLQARVDFVPNKSWKAHVLYETQRSGDFYTAQKPGFFLRFEVSYLLKVSVKESQLRNMLGGGSSN